MIKGSDLRSYVFYYFFTGSSSVLGKCFCKTYFAIQETDGGVKVFFSISIDFYVTVLHIADSFPDRTSVYICI